MLLFYLIFLAITLVIGYYLYVRGRTVVRRVQAEIHLLTILSLLFLVLEVIVWLYLIFVTMDAIITEFSPGKPKPFFLITWVLGIVAYGILAFIREPFDAFLRRRYKERSD